MVGMGGVYPRAYGETRAIRSRRRCLRGLSPRLRGNHERLVLNGAAQGSIPALTGKPARVIVALDVAEVYPRAYGETASVCSGDRDREGLSPRLRGNRGARPLRPATPGSIPALTGKPGE